MKRHKDPLRAATMSSLLLATGTATLAGQEDACGDRASLEVTVLDESGSTVLPGATVVLRWTDPRSCWNGGGSPWELN